MKASGSSESRAMRVLSPRIEPPESVLDGSIARTATRLPLREEAHPELVDERALSHAGHARDADAARAARRRAGAA